MAEGDGEDSAAATITWDWGDWEGQAAETRHAPAPDFRRALYWSVAAAVFLPFILLEAAARVLTAAMGYADRAFWRFREWAYQCPGNQQVKPRGWRT